MIYRLNPLTILVRNQDDPPDSPPWNLHIGDKRRITSYLYKSYKGKNYLHILFESKWYEVHNGDLQELLSICPHLIRKKPWQGVKYLFSKIFTSRYASQSAD